VIENAAACLNRHLAVHADPQGQPEFQETRGCGACRYNALVGRLPAGQGNFWQTSGVTGREIAKLCLRPSLRALAKQSILLPRHCHAARWIASLALAMTIVLLF
jgi:hypothetical protein